jgi:hypothetical protein
VARLNAPVGVGPVPRRLPGTVHSGPLWQAAPDSYLFDLPTVGRFLARRHGDGVRVTVRPAPGATEADVACLLAGPVRTACRLLNGDLALHGSGAVLDGRAVALTGDPAAGRSTLAAALAVRGHPILADGALPIRRTGTGFVAEPADDGLQLWPDTARLLGLTGGAVIRPGLPKRHHRFPAAPAAPLAAVVVLRRWGGAGAPVPRTLTGVSALHPLAHCTAGRSLIAPFGVTAAHFAWCAGIVAEVPVFELCGDRHRDDASVLADTVEALVRRADVGLSTVDVR